MKVLIFDTETTGKPINYKAPASDVENWPRVIQLAWEVADFASRQVEKAQEILIKPDGWEIPTEKFWLDNGFHTKTSIEKGTLLTPVLREFLVDMEEADILVAHNLAFDTPIIQAEMIRYKFTIPKKDRQKVCTMNSGTDVCKLPAKWGYKWPSLSELYQKIFNKEFDGAHQAGADVRAARECFFGLVDLGAVKISQK